MKFFTFLSVTLVWLMFHNAHATLPNYFYREASVGYRNLTGVNIRLAERFSLDGWYGNYFLESPIKIGGKTKWMGWDLNPGFMVDILKGVPVQLSAGGHWRVALRADNYTEARPNLQADVGVPAGPVAFDVRLMFERRYIQNQKFDKDKMSKSRFRTLIKISPSTALTRFKLKPYLFWEGRFQKRQLALHLVDSPYQGTPDDQCDCDDDLDLVDALHGVELGVMSRLSDNFGFGFADQVFILPNTTKTGHHRVSLYLMWHFNATENL